MSRSETAVNGDSSNQNQRSTGEVFESLEDGDKILWDGKSQPLTVTAGYKDTDEDFAPPVMVEGPRGGQKMLNQSKHDPDVVFADSFTHTSSGERVKNLRVVN